MPKLISYRSRIIYLDKTDTSLYVDFKINKKYFEYPFIFKFLNDMRDKCDDIYGEKYRQLRDDFIPLCLDSHDRYYINILRMNTFLYWACDIWNFISQKNKSYQLQSLHRKYNEQVEWFYYIWWINVEMGFWKHVKIRIK